MDLAASCDRDDWTDESCGVWRVDDSLAAEYKTKRAFRSSRRDVLRREDDAGGPTPRKRNGRAPPPHRRGATTTLRCKAAAGAPRAQVRVDVLRRLHERHRRHVDASDGDERAKALERARFLSRALVVLVRYEALISDPGQHGMLPLSVFACLEAWGCEGEGFATPLNATLPTFCSLHGADDAFFGSLGSFFDWRPKRGSFELNPPFTIQTSVVEDHVVGLLEAAERAGEPLSFVYVVPETSSRQRTRDEIRTKKLLSDHIIVRPKETFGGVTTSGHVYRRGNEYQNARKLQWDCPMTTVITFFQTSAAKKKWPVTAEFKKALLESFKPPDAAARERERLAFL